MAASASTPVDATYFSAPEVLTAMVEPLEALESVSDRIFSGMQKDMTNQYNSLFMVSMLRMNGPATVDASEIF